MLSAGVRSTLIALVSTALTVLMTAAMTSPSSAYARPHLAQISAGQSA